VLKKGGTLVWLAAAPFDATSVESDIRVVRADVRCTAERLAILLDWAARGILEVALTKIAFAEAPRAYALSRSSHARGKIVILH
jgi:hypothetical protein